MKIDKWNIPNNNHKAEIKSNLNILITTVNRLVLVPLQFIFIYLLFYIIYIIIIYFYIIYIILDVYSFINVITEHRLY